MFIRNAWYVAAWDHEGGRTDLLRRTLLDEPVVLYRQLDGTPVALEDRCCHRGAPLSLGSVTEAGIRALSASRNTLLSMWQGVEAILERPE